MSNLQTLLMALIGGYFLIGKKRISGSRFFVHKQSETKFMKLTKIRNIKKTLKNRN